MIKSKILICFLLFYLIEPSYILSQQNQVLAHYPLLSNGNDITGQLDPMTLINTVFKDGGIYCNGIYRGMDPHPYQPNGSNAETPILSKSIFNSFSLSVDFKAYGYPPDGQRMPVIVGGDWYRWIGIVLLNDGTIALLYNNENYEKSSFHYSINNWYTALVTYDGNNCKLYINGQLIVSSNFNIIHDTDPSDFTFSTTNFGCGETFWGILKDLYIYSNVIVPKPIYDLKFYNTYENVKIPISTDNGSIKICADGSEVTSITFSGDLNMYDIIFKIEEDPMAINADENGKLILENQGINIKTYKYQHPVLVDEKYGLYKTIHLDVVDSKNQNNIMSCPINIYRAPIIFVHGINSNAQIFDYMINKFLEAQWHFKLLGAMDYSGTHNDSFEINKYLVSDAIKTFIKNSISKYGFSVGKVNVIAHSMGGILTRLYIQSNSYRNDICRFVTLNTPLSGSQSANFIYNNPPLSELLGYGAYSGAVCDLRVNSDAVSSLNNKTNLNHNKVPTHTFSSTCTAAEFEATEFGNLFAILFNSFLPVPATTLQAFLITLYNLESSDGVIPLSSQNGGCYLNSEFSHLSHNDVYKDDDIISKLINYLNQNPFDDQYFSDKGFNPPLLNSIYKTGIKGNYLAKTKKEMENLIIIQNPANGTKIKGGDEISVNITGSNSISKLIIELQSKDWEPIYKVIDSYSANEAFQIPIQSSAPIKILAAGFNDNGFVAMNSVTINCFLTADIDSIRVPTETLYITQNSYTSISVKGYFKDGIERDLTNSPEVIFETQDSTIANFIRPGLLKGIKADTTNVRVIYENNTSLVNIIVIPEEIINTIQNYTHNNQIISAFQLNQNYPNPFNAVSTVEYSVPSESFVTLKIYDILGREITTLVNEHKSTGWYRVSFNGTDLSSGVYFYRMQAGSFVSTKKFVLLK